MSLSITFHGAAGMVTGSKHLIELPDGRRVLLDCGMFQGEGRDSDTKNRRFGFDPHSIDALVLSHAHIDHSGLIPRLVAEGFNGPIHATPATRDLCAIMLEDSARIQESDFLFDQQRAERHGHALEAKEALYTLQDVPPALALFQPLEYGKAREILPGVTLTFTDAGHILGSAAVQLAIDTPQGKKHICFSGDVGRYVDRLLPDPAPFPQADVVICETTYGDRDHPPVHEMKDAFLAEVLRTCVKQQGRLILPAFSIGKTQEILYTLNHLYNEGKLPRIPVFVDSPLSISATAVYRAHSTLLQDDVRAELAQDPDLFDFPGVEFVRKAERSKQLNDRKEPCIIIAASGMMEAGRIRHHLLHDLSDPRNTVLVVGFCAPGTLGADLLEGHQSVRIFGEHVPVRASIVRMESYSAHADRNELLRFLSCQDPARVQQTFLVHGVPSSLEGFKGLLATKGYRGITIPWQGQRIEI